METSNELWLRVRVRLGRLWGRVRDGETGSQQRDRDGKLGGLRLVAWVEGWLRHGNVRANARQPRLLLYAVLG